MKPNVVRSVGASQAGFPRRAQAVSVIYATRVLADAALRRRDGACGTTFAGRPSQRAVRLRSSRSRRHPGGSGRRGRAAPRIPGRGRMLRDTQVPEDGPDDSGSVRKARIRISPLRAGHLRGFDPRKQVGPATSGAAVGSARAGAARGRAGSAGGGPGNEPVHSVTPVAGRLSPPPGVGREAAMVAKPADARRWNQTCTPIDQLEGADADPDASVVRRAD
jgi:hypothetical protein